MDPDTERYTPEPFPLSLITGFLGSGKTTLINRLLTRGDMDETAILVNEFGEIGLDHLLVEQVSEEIVLLQSGCICCTVSGELVDSLRDLFIRRVRGEIPAFRRVVVETTGLADPAPIIHTLMADPTLDERYRLDGIVTTVDACHGYGQLDTHPESVKQAAVADRIVLTKADVAEPESVARLRQRLAALNPGARVIAAEHGDVAPAALFDAGLFDPQTKTADVEKWLNEEAYARRHHGHEHDDGHDHSHNDANRHDARIRAFCLTADQPIAWERFAEWIEMLLSTQGDNILRVKGILNVAGADTPIAIHGVETMFHPPTALPAWRSADRRSRVVFITRDLGQGAIEDSFRAFVTDPQPAE
jgi:G3E family GTPase